MSVFTLLRVVVGFLLLVVVGFARFAGLHFTGLQGFLLVVDLEMLLLRVAGVFLQGTDLALLFITFCALGLHVVDLVHILLLEFHI